MSMKWDLATYNQDDELVLVIEVKTKLDASPEWAAQLRRNILAHGTYPNAPYFLMVFPDRFYLWKDAEWSLEPIEPTAEIDAHSVLQPYLDKSGISAKEISEASLEFIVASWLNGLLHKIPGELDASEQWLVDLGLYDAIAGGSLRREVYA